MRTLADQSYRSLIKQILAYGDTVNTRNSETLSLIGLGCKLTTFPLVTWRKTAVKKALTEMEWFMSGKETCPTELRDWWRGQLYKDDMYIDGYSKQFRRASYADSEPKLKYFDQVAFILNGLQHNPSSRRLILTTWNPGEMANITFTNQNSSTPTTCHNTCTQFFVRDNTLHIHTYQRSADMLLGVPHNWVQTWALGMYFAYHARLKMGSIVWTFGDAHIYSEASHLEVAGLIRDSTQTTFYKRPELIYMYTGSRDIYGTPEFKASDFSIKGDVADPITDIRPKLL